MGRIGFFLLLGKIFLVEARNQVCKFSGRHQPYYPGKDENVDKPSKVLILLQ
jgi:hypothetical protein